MAAAVPPLVFLVEFGWYTIVALCFSSRVPREMYLRAKTWVDRVAAVAIGALGLRLIFTCSLVRDGFGGDRLDRSRNHVPQPLVPWVSVHALMPQHRHLIPGHVHRRFNHL